MRPRHAWLLIRASVCPISLLVYFYVKHEGITTAAIVPVMGAIAFGFVYVALLLLARRTPPPSRHRLVISMELVDVMYEYVYLGYKVEALTDDVVVLVRIRIGSLLFLISLVMFGFLGQIIWLDWPTAINRSDETSGVIALFMSPISLFVVAYFVIAGYGYNRLVFRRTNNPGETAAVVERASFLPSRIRCSTVSMEEYP